MNKWVFILLAVALTIGASSGVVFALTANGGRDDPDVPNDTESAGEVSSGLPSDDESISDFGDEQVVTSIDDIDPDVCNLVHNINACTPEELEEQGMTLHGDPGPETEVEGMPETEPLFVDGEPQYQAQSHGEADEQDCYLAGGVVYASSDGEVGCIIVQDLDDGGEGETQAQPPLVIPETEPLFVDGEPQYEVQSYEDAVKQDCGLAGGAVYFTSDGEIRCLIAHDLDDGGEGETQAQPPLIIPGLQVLPAE